MAQKTKAQLVAEIDAIYVDCGTECITPEAVNTFEKDKTDSYAILNEDNNFSGTATWTKQIREHKGANITVGSTLTLTNDGNYFHVTGASTSITSITTRQHGTRVSFYFVNSQTLQHSSNLHLPNGADYVTQAGEIIQFVSEGSGNWRFFSTNRVVVKTFDVTLTNGSAIRNMGTTPIQVVADPGTKIQVLSANAENIGGGTQDYDFAVPFSLIGGEGGILTYGVAADIDFASNPFEFNPAYLNGLSSSAAFMIGSRNGFLNTGGIFLSTIDSSDATQGDRSIRVCGTYVEFPA